MEILWKSDTGIIVGFDEKDEFEKWFNSECWTLKNGSWTCTSCAGGQPRLNALKIQNLLKGVQKDEN